MDIEFFSSFWLCFLLGLYCAAKVALPALLTVGGGGRLSAASVMALVAHLGSFFASLSSAPLLKQSGVRLRGRELESSCVHVFRDLWANFIWAIGSKQFLDILCSGRWGMGRG